MVIDDRNRARHIRDAAREAIGFYEGFDYVAFTYDSRTFRAVIQCMEVIGEAAAHLSGDARQAMSEVPWEKIRGMRNHLAHAYFDIDLEILWLVVQRDLPRSWRPWSGIWRK